MEEIKSSRADLADRKFFIRRGAASTCIEIEREDGGVSIIEIYRSEELREFANQIALGIAITAISRRIDSP